MLFGKGVKRLKDLSAQIKTVRLKTSASDGFHMEKYSLDVAVAGK